MATVPRPTDTAGSHPADRFDLDAVTVRRTPRLRLLVGTGDALDATPAGSRSLLAAADAMLAELDR